MAISIFMPALSPTMEEGTLARWLVKEGDEISSGDLLAEIETDKATMEFEAVDEGIVAKILVPEGSENVKVGTVIALIAEEGEDAGAITASQRAADTAEPDEAAKAGKNTQKETAPQNQKMEDKVKEVPMGSEKTQSAAVAERVKISPLARRLAAEKGVDISHIKGSGPHGRIIKADIETAEGGSVAAGAAEVGADVTHKSASVSASSTSTSETTTSSDFNVPHVAEKLSGMRKTIARRLTEAKQSIPHYRVSIDINIDKLLSLRSELNTALEARGIKLSVNDLMIKAQAAALMQAPDSNVSYTDEAMIRYARADIAVAVSIPGGLITPIVTSADTKSLSSIAVEMQDLAERAKAGKLKMHEYQGGTASLSNMGMFGVTSFDAVINPPHGMILAISAGIKKPVVIGDSVEIATMMTATGSFDHRAIDGATGAAFMKAFKETVENPVGMLA